jgi:integrase
MRLRYLDLRKMTYYVAEGYKQYKFIRPKRGKKRLVDLPNFLVKELVSYVTHLKKENLKRGLPGEADLLFADPKEKRHWPYSQRKIQALLRRVCTGAGLRVRNPHDLRHTYATIMLMAHQSPAYVQRQLGHSSISITVDTYGHWIPGEGRHGLEEALLGLSTNCPSSDFGQSPKRVRPRKSL